MGGSRDATYSSAIRVARIVLSTEVLRPSVHGRQLMQFSHMVIVEAELVPDMRAENTFAKQFPMVWLFQCKVRDQQ